MPLEIVRNDILKMEVEAIVNPSHPKEPGLGGVDGLIHKAVGPDRMKELKVLDRLNKTWISPAPNLPCKYIIHTIGPLWIDGKSQEEDDLARTYRDSLELAKKMDLESIAFPLLSAGTYGFPKDRALRIAIGTIGDFLLANDMLVYLVVYNREAFSLSEKLFSSIKSYIDDKYVDDMYVEEVARDFSRAKPLYQLRKARGASLVRAEIREDKLYMDEAPLDKKEKKRSLEEVVENLDESFSQMLLRLIDEKGFTDVEIYKRANIDRRHFSKIRNDNNYKPSKSTVLAFAIALKLSLDETRDLLLKAGFALSPSSKFDLIIQFFIERENYNIFEINEALFAFDERLLGL